MQPENKTPFDPTLSQPVAQTPSAAEIARANNREIGKVQGDEPTTVVPTPVVEQVSHAESSKPSRLEDIPGMRVGQDLTPDGMILQTKLILESEPRLPLFIPLDQGEKIGAYKTAIINGYRFDIKKNTMVYVPKSIQELIMNSMGAVNEAIHNHPANLASAGEGRRSALDA